MTPAVRTSPQQIVQDISRLLALTGPTVIAVDQIDTLIAQSVQPRCSTRTPGGRTPGAGRGADQIADGLMALRESPAGR